MSPFLLGVSLSLQDRALGGAYTFAHGKRPAFLCLDSAVLKSGGPQIYRPQPHAQDHKLPRGRPNAPVRFSLQLFNLQLEVHSSGMRWCICWMGHYCLVVYVFSCPI